MTARDVAEWMAFDRLEPFGQQVDHEMLAGIRAELATEYRGRRRPFQVEDFMPARPLPRAPVSQEQLWSKLDAAMLALGGKRRADG